MEITSSLVKSVPRYAILAVPLILVPVSKTEDRWRG